jgi:hypothetical protein
VAVDTLHAQTDPHSLQPRSTDSMSTIPENIFAVLATQLEAVGSITSDSSSPLISSNTPSVLSTVQNATLSVFFEQASDRYEWAQALNVWWQQAQGSFGPFSDSTNALNTLNNVRYIRNAIFAGWWLAIAFYYMWVSVWGRDLFHFMSAVGRVRASAVCLMIQVGLLGGSFLAQVLVFSLEPQGPSNLWDFAWTTYNTPLLAENFLIWVTLAMALWAMAWWPALSAHGAKSSPHMREDKLLRIKSAIHPAFIGLIGVSELYQSFLIGSVWTPAVWQDTSDHTGAVVRSVGAFILIAASIIPLPDELVSVFGTCFSQGVSEADEAVEADATAVGKPRSQDGEFAIQGRSSWTKGISSSTTRARITALHSLLLAVGAGLLITPLKTVPYGYYVDNSIANGTEWVAIGAITVIFIHILCDLARFMATLIGHGGDAIRNPFSDMNEAKANARAFKKVVEGESADPPSTTVTKPDDDGDLETASHSIAGAYRHATAKARSVAKSMRRY